MLTSGDEVLGLHMKKRDVIEGRNIVSSGSGGTGGSGEASGSGSGTTAVKDDVANTKGAGDVEKEKKEHELDDKGQREGAEVRDWVYSISAAHDQATGSGEQDENIDKLGEEP